MRWVILFRGINVGGKNKLPMKALVDALEAAGLIDVLTYIQSGNVVASSSLQRESLSLLIQKTVLESFGFEPAVLCLSVPELQSLADANPFPDAVEDASKLHLFVCAQPPAADADEKLEALAAADERTHLNDQALYLHAPSGVGRSKLAAGAERALGVPTTARNWRTVTMLLEMAG